MTTERQVTVLIQHFQVWAAGFQEAADLYRQAIQDGDPAGVGIARLVGRVEAYEDAAKALRNHVEGIRSDERKVKLEVVS